MELHNTVYVASGEHVDGIDKEDDLTAWLRAIGDRLPARAREADAARHHEFLALREAAREALHAAVDGRPPRAAALEAINVAAGRAPLSPLVAVGADGRLREEKLYHTADAAEVALAALAADVIELITGPNREQLRACGAPGCVLMFVKAQPRRTWCSESCGNRTRQARHYERTRRARR